MAGTEDTDALVIAYVEGELDASAVRDFERRLAADADLRAEVEGLRAMKELLAADLRHGRDNGTDEPPAHLVNAILQAEALARPAAIRDAAALARNPAPSFTARMTRWLVGGSALVAGAAALLFVVARPTAETDAVVAAAPAADGASALRAQVAPEEPSSRAARSAQAEQPMEREDSTAGVSDKREAQGFAGAAGDTPADAPKPVALSAKSARDEADTGADLDASDDAAAGAGVARGGDPSNQEGAQPAKERSSVDSITAGPGAGSADGAIGGRGLLGGALSQTADSAARARSAANAEPPASVPAAASPIAPAPPPPSSREEARQRLVELRRANKPGSGKDSRATDGEAAGAIAEAKPSTTAGSEAKAENAPDARSKAPAKKAKTEGKESESKGAPKAKRDSADPSADMSPDALRDAQTADLAFTTGLRELKGKRYLEALAAFESAERADRRHLLGVSPVVGKMRALSALGRPADVARLGGRLLYADLKAADVVDGVLLGADAAEKTGDTLLAEQLWTRLLEVPAQKAQAERALARVRNAVRNKALELEAPAADASAPTDSR